MDMLLTAQDVAKVLNVSVAWVYDHSNRKEPIIPSVRLGKAVRFRLQDIEDFVREMTKRVAC